MSFTDDLWQSIQPTYSAILEHPFIRQLTEGTLSRERFVFYMKQDSLYLREFSRALAIAGARATDVPCSLFFVQSAHHAAVVEQSLHEGYFREFGVVQDAQRAPANFAYSSYVLATAALAPHAVAIAALLPCFWIYREVGNEIVKRAEANIETNPYARWIKTYSGDDFNASVDKAIGFVEAAAAAVTEAERAEMTHAFDNCARLEWLFWDAAYRMEGWPPYATVYAD